MKEGPLIERKATERGGRAHGNGYVLNRNECVERTLGACRKEMGKNFEDMDNSWAVMTSFEGGKGCAETKIIMF